MLANMKTAKSCCLVSPIFNISDGLRVDRVPVWFHTLQPLKENTIGLTGL